MYALRQWSVRNARVLEWLYEYFEGFMIALDPLWLLIGYDRIEGPICAMERQVKAALFDCQMCGHCVLSQTGMSCPMNCPKELRNGPCGGVRGKRVLRSQAADALCLGRCLGGLRAHA